MEPAPLNAAHWATIDRALLHATLFVGLALGGALTLLLAQAVVPALVADAGIAPRLARWRPLLWAVAALAFLLAAYASAQAVVLGVGVVQYYYPRFGY